MSYVFERWPIPVSLDEYESVAVEIQGHLARIPGLISIYGFGGVSAPGISDLDRIAVVDRRRSPLPSIWPFLSKRQRYVALHTPFLVDVETFKLHRWFSFLSDLELLQGEPIEAEEPEALDSLSVVLGVEGLVSARIRLERLRFGQRIKVRSLLCELHNLRHDLRHAGVSTTSSAAAWQVVDEVSRLRSEWWEIDPDQRVLRVSKLVPAAVAGVDEALDQCEAPIPKSNPGSFYLGGRWRNVRVTTAPARAEGVGALIPVAMTRRFRRASELRWRWARHQVQVPPGMIALLDSRGRGVGSPLNARREIVNRYVAFVDSNSGWSRIGLADPFTIT